MTGVAIGLIALVGFLILMFIGIPIPFAMIIAATLGIMAMTDSSVAGQIMVSEVFNTFTSYALTVGPMFGLMGFLASYSGLGSKLFTTMNYFFGHRKNGLANATQIACAGFGAICGSPPACESTMAAVAYPEMRKHNYSVEIAGTGIAAGSALSVLIPPSNNLILYGIITETSIGKLFLAGILPGIILCVFNILAITWMGWRHPDWTSKSQRHPWKERFQSLLNGGLLMVAIIFVISMGGMFAGFFTPTEAGAVGAFSMLIITIVTKQLNWKKFFQAMFAGVRLQAMVFMLLACANVFGKMFSVSTIPQVLGGYVEGLDVSNWIIMLVIVLIYFIMGMFTDLMSMTLVTMPIFFPIVCGTLGYSPIWFGVIITLVIVLGALTPPVGQAIFILKGCLAYDDEVTITRLFRGAWPFIIANLVMILLLVPFPSIATWLPALAQG